VALQGWTRFPHADVFFLLDQVDADKVLTGARHPRDSPDWPEVGIFAQRTKNRPNAWEVRSAASGSKAAAVVA